MSSPTPCTRCSKLLALSPSGLCRECAAIDATAGPTSAFVPSVPTSDSFAPTVTNVPPLYGPAALTRTEPPAADTASTPSGPQYPLPEAPPGYELIRRLGGGGMGDVYLAREHPSERLVAIKFLRYPEQIDGFKRFVIELQVLAKLDDPHIVRVFASDFLRATPFFTMEYMEGGSLARAVESTPVPVAEAVRIVRTVAGAVGAAHAKGVIHRDLKPSNILLAPDGTPKVADFGLAKHLGADEDFTRSTAALGTPGYMPPEQVARRHGKAGTWSDVYGLGATLYHLLTNRAPFVGQSSAEIVSQVLNDPPARPRALRAGVPTELEGIVLKCLEKAPANRYQSIAEFVADLDRFTTGQRPVAPPLTRRRRAARWVIRNQRGALAVVTGVVLLAGAFALGAVYWPKRPPVDVEHSALLERDLDAGGAVALLGPDGKPRYHRWAVGAGALIPSETEDGTIALQTQGLAFLELLADPRRDRYRVTAILRHLQANPQGAGVGVYIGYDRIAAPTGTAVHPAVLAEFNETFTLNEVLTKKTDAHGVDLVAANARTAEGESPDFAGVTGNGHLRFTPHPDQPRPWRVIVFEVSPDGVELFWATEKPAKDGKPAEIGTRVFVGRMSAKDLAAHRRTVRGELGNIIGDPSPVVPEWHPRRPLGIWAIDSTVSIRSVTVEPLPN